MVVIDDGSTDETLKRLEPLEVKVIAHPYNIGNGAAIKTGIRHACGEIILMMDGDGQHDPLDIPRLIEQIGPYDMAIGARSSGSQSTHRMVANQFYNLFASYVANFFIRDLTSGFRAIKASVLKRFTYLLPNTFSYPTTLTLSLLRAGHSLCYEPIVAAERKSKSKIKPIRDGVRFLSDYLQDRNVLFAVEDISSVQPPLPGFWGQQLCLHVLHNSPADEHVGSLFHCLVPLFSFRTHFRANRPVAIRSVRGAGVNANAQCRIWEKGAYTITSCTL